MVALGIAVDDLRTEQKALVEQLLVECRLAGTKRAEAENRRVAIAVGPLAQVEAHRLPRSAERVAEVEAPARAGEVRGDRHHRRDLLGRHNVVVVADSHPLTRELGHEQLELRAERAVELHLTICAPGRLDAALELRGVCGGHRYGERCTQERRLALGLKLGEQVTRLLRAVVAPIRDALIALGLGAGDLVGVLNAAAHEPQCKLVRQVARGEAEINAERQRLGCGEHQLQPPAGEVGPLGERTGHQLRLPALPRLGFDPQRAPAMFDVAVQPAQHVRLERRENGCAIAFEEQPLRFMQTVDDGLANRATERAAYEPLHLNRAHRPCLDEVRDPGVRGIGTQPKPFQLTRRKRVPVTPSERFAQPLQELARRSLEEARDLRADIALGRLETYREVDGRYRVADVAELCELRFDVTLEGPWMRSPVFVAEL